MELYLLRHAHAGDPASWDGPDESRPLSDKGERQADRLGRFLADTGCKVDAIISSPKVRAVQTANIVAGRLGLVAGRLGLTVREDARLAGEVSVGTLEAVLLDAGDPLRAMVVGHDPDFSELVAILCDAGAVPMRKGAFARIDIARPLGPGGGTLRWLVPPDLLRPDR